jgi:protease-4
VAARRGVWLVLSFIAVAIVVSMGGVIMASLFVSRGPAVPAATALVLRSTGGLVEVEGDGLLDQLVEAPPTVRGVVDALRRAKTDRRVRGLLVQPAAGSPFWAKTQEIRDAIVDFRASGKKTVAFLEYGGDQDYYLATACERVVLLPTSVLDLKGLATYEVFLRGTLDKLGVYPDLLHIGDYKTAINTFTEKTFTPAHREMAESLNHDALDQLVITIAAARKKTPEEIRALIDQGPFLPEDALRTGLVDELAYRDRARLRGRHDYVGDEPGGRRQRRVGHARRVHHRGGRGRHCQGDRGAHRQSGRVVDCVRRHLAGADAGP